MPSREESSMQKNTPLAQAQNSVDRFSNAVADAETHPNETMIKQAYRTEEKVRNAIANLQDEEHQEPVERLKERFEEQQLRLQGTEEEFYQPVIMAWLCRGACCQ